MTDVWFAGGLVVDGSGKDPASVDVCVTDNVITSIGKAPAGAVAAVVVKDGQIAKDIR